MKDLLLPNSIEGGIVFLVSFIAITLLAGAVMMLLRDLLVPKQRAISPGNRGRYIPGQPLRTNPKHPTSPEPVGTIPQLMNSPASARGEGFSARMDNWFSQLHFETGLGMPGDVALLAEIAGGLVLGGALYLWLDDVIVGAVGFFAGMGLMVGLFMVLRYFRRNKLREQLADAADHLARAVRAGQTIEQSLQLVGDCLPDPLGIELRRCAGQMGMGLSVDAAMRALSRRVAIPEMRILSSTFIVQRRAGGNLPATLERLARVIRDRISYQRQFRAATAGSRMSMIIVASAAPLVALYMVTFQREFFDRFFLSTLGMALLATAVGLYVMGLFWIFRILRMNY